jgi:hypothetical protein
VQVLPKRGYCLTRTADLGEPVHRLAAFAGHADIRVTQQYLAVGDSEAARPSTASTAMPLQGLGE